ncbi:hypothetical protein Hanom_Chr10g00884671 [Helianthus anomalus]
MKQYLFDRLNQTTDKSRWRTVDSYSNNFRARVSNFRTFNQRVTTDHIYTVFRVKREPCRDLYSFFK